MTLGLTIPILDWGLGRGKYRMAQSSEEVVKTTVEQARTDFVQSVYLNVMQFNMQDDQLFIAAKSDTIAQKRYDLTKQRFLIGKVDVLDLNVSLSEKDAAKSFLPVPAKGYEYEYGPSQDTMTPGKGEDASTFFQQQQQHQQQHRTKHGNTMPSFPVFPPATCS